MFLKLIWGCRLVFWHAEDHDQLGDDMQGSRKHRGTMDLLSKKCSATIVLVNLDKIWQFSTMTHDDWECLRQQSLHTQKHEGK
jgi:hypothetical protein